jgi:chromosome segregation ATPase
MSRTTMIGVRGQPLPDLEAVGLARKMKPLASLIAEQGRLYRRAEDLGREQDQLREQITHLDQERTQAWGRALRSGEEAPTDEAIQRAEKRLEEVGKELQAVRHAGELSAEELRQVVAEHAAEWDQLVQAKGEAILAEAQQMADALSAKLAETEDLAALHGWLESGGQFFTPPSPATVTIDNLVHERMRALGLVTEMEVIG